MGTSRQQGICPLPPEASFKQEDSKPKLTQAPPTVNPSPVHWVTQKIYGAATSSRKGLVSGELTHIHTKPVALNHPGVWPTVKSQSQRAGGLVSLLPWGSETSAWVPRGGPFCSLVPASPACEGGLSEHDFLPFLTTARRQQPRPFCSLVCVCCAGAGEARPGSCLGGQNHRYSGQLTRSGNLGSQVLGHQQAPALFLSPPQKATVPAVLLAEAPHQPWRPAP